MTRRALVPVVLGAAVLLAGCGGSSGGSGIPVIPPARIYRLADFSPAGPIRAGKPTRISFRIIQPNGQPLTSFKTGPGPHTGVHLIFVRKDLAAIIHHHPPLHGTATISDTITFPKPGPYRLVVDVYAKPAAGTADPTSPLSYDNFQLERTVTVAGAYHAEPLPPPASTTTVDGYRFTLSGATSLHSVQAALVHVTVTSPGGGKPTFEPWFGALAHAIFFRRGTLDYFHTHICAPGAVGCTSILGNAKVTGTSTTPGKLTVGVLVPVPGTWRLFLQCQIDHHVLTAPFTLRIA